MNNNGFWGDDAHRKMSLKKDSSAIKSKKYSLLLIDDIKLNFMLTKKFFESNYPDMFDIQWAASGEAALLLLEEKDTLEGHRKRFDIILVDHEMTGINGGETIRQIRLLEVTHSTASQFLVSFSTALANHEDGQKCVPKGANTGAYKPIEAIDMKAVINQFFIHCGTSSFCIKEELGSAGESEDEDTSGNNSPR